MKKLLIFLLFAVAIGGSVAYYLYNKPVSDLKDVKPEASVNANELFDEYNEDELQANDKYLGKIIEVTGVIREIKSDDEGKTIVLQTGDDIFGINCGLSSGHEEMLDKYKSGDQVKIRGECTGISMDVVLVRSVIVE